MTRDDSLTDRAFAAATWAVSGAGAQALLRFLVVLVLARLLGPVEFGLMAMALLFLNLSTILTDFGIGQAVIQFRALTREHVRTSYTLSLLMAIAVGATCWLFSPAIATWFGESQLEWILRAVAASFLVRAFATTAEALLQRELRFRELAIADVAGYVLGYALPSIILAWQGFGVWSLVAGVVGQAIVRTTVVLMFRRHSIIPLLRRSAVTDLWFNGLGFFLARITTFVATEGDNLVVGKALGAATLGIYSRAYQLLMMPVNLLGMSVDRVLFPAMSEAQDDPRRLGRAFGRSTAAIGIALGPVSAFCIVAAPELVLVLLGPQWTAVVAPFASCRQSWCFERLIRSASRSCAPLGLSSSAPGGN